MPRRLVMALQGGRRELMPGEDVLDASVINRLVVTRSDNPGQLARGERMGHGQPHNVLLDMLGETRLDGRPAAGMREGAPIEQAHHTGPPKAPQIAPQLPVAQPRDSAVLGQGPLLPSHRAKRFITRERVTIRSRVTAEEVEWEHTSRRLRHRFLLSHERSTKDVREDRYEAESQPQRDVKDAPPLFCRLN